MRFHEKLLKNIFFWRATIWIGLIVLTFFWAFGKLVFTIFGNSSHFFTFWSWVFSFERVLSRHQLEIFNFKNFCCLQFVATDCQQCRRTVINTFHSSLEGRIGSNLPASDRRSQPTPPSCTCRPRRTSSSSRWSRPRPQSAFPRDSLLNISTLMQSLCFPECQRVRLFEYWMILILGWNTIVPVLSSTSHE